MKKAMAIVGIFFLFSIFAVVSMIIGYYNTGVQYDAKLAAVWKQNEISLNTYTTKVQEIAQVPSMYKKDLKEMIDSTFKGRYGENGSKAVMQWIQEQNLPFDSSMYKQIQQVIESGRNDFKTSQELLADNLRVYEVELNSFPGVFVYRMLGFPKVPLDKYKIISTSDVKVKMETGEDSVIQLRN